MSEKLTDWFEPSVKPELVGVYQTRSQESDSGETYQHWNGKMWGLWMPNPESAARKCTASEMSMRQHPQWRGLAENPEK